MYYFDNASREVKINPMFISFEVNITQDMLDEGVVGYEIVRVQREENDKTSFRRKTFSGS